MHSTVFVWISNVPSLKYFLKLFIKTSIPGVNSSVANGNTLDNICKALFILISFSGVKGNLNASAIYCNTVSHFSLLKETLSYIFPTIFPIFFFKFLSVHLINTFIKLSFICSFISFGADFQLGLYDSPSGTWINLLAITAAYKVEVGSVDKSNI